MSDTPDPHVELGVPPDATAEEVHRAFRRRLREHHPDARHDDAPDRASDEALQRVLVAYQSLRKGALSPAMEKPTVSPSENPRLQTSANQPWVPGEPPIRATSVTWVQSGRAPGQYPRRERIGDPIPTFDEVIRWLLDR